MDVDKIGLVLARVSELSTKMTTCIQKELENGDKEEGGGANSKQSKAGPDAELEGDYDEETECLLNIKDALESLESQLSSLQALHQRQWYEKEVALDEIRISRKKLLEKLKGYKGEHLEIVHEAIAFAGETVDDNTDLLLPPYPSWPSHSLVSDNEDLPQYPFAHKTSQNGLINDLKVPTGRSNHERKKDQSHTEPRWPFARAKALVGALTKAAITVVGVITVLNLAGYEPMLKKRDNPLKSFGLLEQQEDHERGTTMECPPGKVPVVENGELRCLVKERVEIPFEPLIANPDAKYGCG